MDTSSSKSNQASIEPKMFQQSISASGRLSSSTISTSISSLSSPATSSSPNQITLGRSNSHSTSASKTESNNNGSSDGKKKKMCICVPTTHPGSFRCRLHRNLNTVSNHRLSARRSAMKNSLVKIGTVEGDLMKRALLSDDFKLNPSRLSVMSNAKE